MLSRFLKRYRPGLFLSFFLSGVNATITLVVLSRINILLTHGLREHGVNALSVGLLWLIALVIVGVVSQLFLAKFGGELVGGMRTELSRQFIGVEFEKLADRKHTIFGSLVEDVGRIVNLVVLIPQLVYQAFMMLLYLGYLAFISRLLFIVLIPALMATTAVTVLLVRVAASRFDAMRSTEEKVFECFRAITEGKKEMSLSAQRAAHFSDHVLAPAVRRAQEIMINAIRIVGVNNAASVSASYATILILAYLGYAEFKLPVHQVTEFVLTALFLAGPTTFLTNAIHPISIGMASLRHLDKLGLGRGLPKGVQAEVGARPMTAAQWKVIGVSNVTFHYPTQADGTRYQFGPIDLSVQKGETVFVTGENGSGKSTLLLLLCGLLRPTGGSVVVDDCPVAGNMTDYRARFSGVFGDFFLFSDVIDKWGQNIPDSRALELLGKLKLTAKVDVKDGKLSRLSLSTGQRKRLALMQCYAEDKDIWFFDEWAAEQDVRFRDFFYCELIPELKRRGKTLLVISHDDRYFGVADRVIKLEDGRVISDVARRPSPDAIAAHGDA